MQLLRRGNTPTYCIHWSITAVEGHHQRTFEELYQHFNQTMTRKLTCTGQAHSCVTGHMQSNYKLSPKHFTYKERIASLCSTTRNLRKFKLSLGLQYVVQANAKC